MAALSVALMYLALLAVQYSATGDAFFLGAAAGVLMLLWLIASWYWALLAYAALAALGFITLGPALIWPFFLAYGLWIFIKMPIEYLCFSRSWPLAYDCALKAVAAILLSLIARFALADMLLGQAFQGLSQKLGHWANAWPVLLVLLILLYDYLLTVLRRHLLERVWPYIK